MNKTFLQKQLSNLNRYGLPSKCVFRDREVIATVTAKKDDRVFAQYGVDSNYSRSILVCLADMHDTPKEREIIVVDGANYRVIGVSNQSDISLLIDLEKE